MEQYDPISGELRSILVNKRGIVYDPLLGDFRNSDLEYTKSINFDPIKGDVVRNKYYRASIHINRVVADSGAMISREEIVKLDKYLLDNDIDHSLFWSVYAGSKTSKLYSYLPLTSAGDFTVTRASTRTRINQAGQSESVAANVPVIDWTTGSPILSVVDDVITLTTPANCTKVVITVNGVDTEYNSVFPTLTLPVGNISKIVATVGAVEYDLLKAYLLRVNATIVGTQNGTTSEQGARDLKDTYKYLSDNNLLADTRLLFLSNAGLVQRTDGTGGILKFYRTAFDLNNTNDLDGSATATAQPRLIGGIAPGSKVAASNQNGEARFFTHTPISFAANEAWSVSFVFNASQLNSLVTTALCGRAASNLNVIRLDGTGKLVIVSDAINVYTSAANFLNKVGKSNILTITNDGANQFKIYWNGAFVENIAGLGDFTFTTLMLGRAANFNGSMRYYRIQSGAMTAAQALSEATFLRTKYPEIESVVIGSDEWTNRNWEAVATPAGNVINNVTVNGAVSKLVGGDFESTTGWTLIDSTISGGKLNCNRATGSVELAKKNATSTLLNKYVKVTVTIDSVTSGSILINVNGYVNTPVFNSAGTHTAIVKVINAFSNTSIYIYSQSGFVGVVDNLIIEELNWSNATEIYNAVYAATAGTAAQKEYAALKEAAMWCYYNNDAANGAIYGKLYNWYAAKLLDLDMVTASFGWRVPTSAQFTTLANALGGTAVAGGKMKMTGLDYWNTPNTGADNSSGFTALAGGLRDDTGALGFLKTRSYFYTINNEGFRILNTSAELLSAAYTPVNGFSLRLIKS